MGARYVTQSLHSRLASLLFYQYCIGRLLVDTLVSFDKGGRWNSLTFFIFSVNMFAVSQPYTLSSSGLTTIFSRGLMYIFISINNIRVVGKEIETKFVRRVLYVVNV